MKVLYDHQIFNNQKYGGISRYFVELMKNFDVKNSFNLSLFYSENLFLKDVKNLKPISLLENKKFKGRDRLFLYCQKINKIKSILNLKFGGFDIFHPTEYDDYFLDYIGDKPFILTVYDMIHEIFYKSNKSYIDNKKKLINKASKIIAISENTKKDIVRLLGVSADKIEVIHLASSLNVNKRKKIMLPDRYLLFVGNRGEYKNFLFFLKSILPIFKKDSNLHLVCVGGSLFTQAEKIFIFKNGLSEKILHTFLTDDQLSYVYSKALAFIFPSLYEGFGIPILESFSCGCPVVLSDRSSFPEIALDAALYFDPESEESILNGVEKIIFNDDLRKKLIAKAFLREKAFAWKKMAKKTNELYRSL